MEYQLTIKIGERAVEWTWDGIVEMDHAQGQRSAIIKSGVLHDMILFYRAGSSGFVAKWKGGPAPKAKKGKW